jgi:TonB family protein
MEFQSNDIEKYLRGELTASEMHALEQKALRDPFLAEALEGAEHAGPENFALDLHNLQRSIHEKSRHKKPRTITLNGWGLYLGIAAGLSMLAMSMFIIFTMIKQQRPQLSKLEQSETKAPTSVQADTTLTENTATETTAAAETETKNEQPPVLPKKENKPRQKPPVIGNQAGGIASVTESDLEQSTDDSVRVQNEVNTSGEIAAMEKPVDVSTETLETKTTPQLATRSESPVGATAKLDLSERTVRGKVISAEDGGSLPGVNVIIKGTNKGTVTDAQGEYEIPVGENHEAIVFSFIGLTSQEQKITDRSEVNVAMDADVSQLSEVVVTGVGVQRITEETHPIIEMAEPEGGRKAFKKYLEEQRQYPKQALDNKVQGKVVVEFTVQPNGQLSDFRILKGLGYGCDEELIRLIKEGPAWVPTKKDNQPVEENVKIRLKFDLPEKK